MAMRIHNKKLLDGERVEICSIRKIPEATEIQGMQERQICKAHEQIRSADRHGENQTMGNEIRDD